MTNQQLIVDVQDFGDLNSLVSPHKTSQPNQEDVVLTNVGRLQHK